MLTYVGKLSRARAELREAYRLAPANPYISTLLAFVSATSGRDAEAIKFAELSLALGGSDYPLRYARALAGAHAGNLEILRDFKLKKLAPAPLQPVRTEYCDSTTLRFRIGRASLRRDRRSGPC